MTNVFDLVDLLPRLKVNQDEELNRFAAEIKDRLCNFSAHDLKKNEILRAATATDATQILSQMDAVLRGRERDAADMNDKSTPAERAQCRGHLLAHVGLHGGCNAMTKHLTPAVRIQKARTALLLDHPFFGSLLFRLGGRASDSIQTMATDGVSLFYNPEFVETLNATELAGVLAQEVMHPALQHHTRRGGGDRKRWNMACDYAINPLLLDARVRIHLRE